MTCRSKVLILAVCIASTLAMGQGSGSARIAIDAADTGRALSPTMYGFFFEDINHAADGGLYAELIRNRDFEDDRVPEDMRWIDDSTIVNPVGWKGAYRRPGQLAYWTLLTEHGASARMQCDTAQPLHATNPQSMRFDVLSSGKGRAGVANEGYWGVPVRAGETYHLSFYARRDGRSRGRLQASLEGTSGRSYASVQVRGIGTQWKQYRCSFTATESDSTARLVLWVSDPGTLWFDGVSLFPSETWKRRPYGMRRDLAQLLGAMRPSFVRFPGGCVVEGATLENRIQWKRTIGDPAARPGHWNLWGYHATDGLGFHEFLQLCEDLGAAPLYVINVGMSCQGRVGMVAREGEIATYLQDALDALEYAMAPVTSRWGALRAANGHPAPFVVTYVEIGNENWGPIISARTASSSPPSRHAIRALSRSPMRM